MRIIDISRLSILICIVLPLLLGCAAVFEEPKGEPVEQNYSLLYQEEAGEFTWVVQEFAGGADSKFQHKYPPDSVRMLLNHGVAVYDFHSILLKVCLALGCPTFRVGHHALIRTIDLEKAAELGFALDEMIEDAASME